MLFPLSSPLVVRDGIHPDRVVRPGHLVWLADWVRYSIVAPRESDAAAASVPASALEEYGDPADFEVIQDSPLLAPVRSFVTSLTQSDKSMSALSEYFTEKLLAEMASSLVLESRGVPGLSHSGKSLFDQAMAHIAAFRTDNTLTAPQIAQTLGVSVRQLQRAFSAEGTSPAREIRRQRTTLALDMLRDPTFELLTVAQIAKHSGFTGPAELRRALDQFHGLTPREVRESVSSGGGVEAEVAS